MMNLVNKSPYLRNTRDFPEELHQLATEINKTYVEIASAVNNRTIGIYSVNKSSIDGNRYFFTSQPNEGLRQIYTFTGTSNISLGFKLSSIYGIANMYGTYIDSAGNVYGLIAGTSVAISGQISFYLSVVSGPSDMIVFVLGSGEPALVSGMIVVEWISNV
jgi:hypothetical protein